MKKLIIGTSVVVATALIAKKLNKKQPGIQVGRIEGLDVALNLEDVASAAERQRHLERINRKMKSGRIDF